jgi:hypothetical protein
MSSDMSRDQHLRAFAGRVAAHTAVRPEAAMTFVPWFSRVTQWGVRGVNSTLLHRRR